MSLPPRTHIPTAALKLRALLTPITPGDAVVLAPDEVRRVGDILMSVELDGHDLINRQAALQQRCNDHACEIARMAREIERLSGRPWRRAS